MSDDIREVMRTTPFSPLKRTKRSGRQEDDAQQHSGGWAEEEETPEQANGTGATVEVLAREVTEANDRLGKAGKKVRLRLARGQTGFFIEIILPGEGDATIVTRKIAADEIEDWVMRLETTEGLMIDEKL